MKNNIIFSDIKERILYHLGGAKDYIWVAVAWVTDEDILNVLKYKILSGVQVIIVTMNDDINRKRFMDDSVLKKEEHLFLRDCHHKYCIIDDEILLNGSFNWTKNASKRGKGENLLITTDESSINSMKVNFQEFLYRKAEDSKPKGIEDFYIFQLKTFSYDQVISNADKAWWVSLSDNWKEFFYNEIVEDLKSDIDLKHFLNNNYHNEEFENPSGGYRLLELEVLSELVSLVKCIISISSPIKYDVLGNLEPLFFLKHLKKCVHVDFESINDYIRLKTNKYLDFESITIKKTFHIQSLAENIFSNVNHLNISCYDFSQPNIRKLPNNLKSLIISQSKELYDNFIWFSWFKEMRMLESLEISNAKISFSFSQDEKKSFDRYESLSLNNCEIWNAPEWLYPMGDKKVLFDLGCFFELSNAGPRIKLIDSILEEKRGKFINNFSGGSEYKYTDNKGNWYKFVNPGLFIDKYGNECCFMENDFLKDKKGNTIFDDGTVLKF